ncbi:MAG: type II toxin-antitoxin system RelE/ParE family toxin [Candidatus Dormibacteraeota bacterium]|nr:type II toxin-antitoxin system RelE/ParE family toxin [Candidatus Dormibacteraeota bacterium]MBO0746270.1 type II toxin-antitoxin system RelE/ParE family toxin [Candidatus Dormibacteraeota bacterium]
MPDYQVTLAPSAVRELKKLPPDARRRVQGVIELLAGNPRPPAAKPLVGGAGEWRVRTGVYRVIYEINDQALDVLILRIAHRREVYRRH